MVSRACVPGSHESVAICEMVLGRLPPRAGHRRRSEAPPRLSARAASLLVLELWPEGQACLGRYGRGCALGAGRLVHVVFTLSVPHYSSQVSPRQELAHSSGAPVLGTAAQGTPGDGGQWGICLQSHRTMYTCLL